MSSNVRPAGKAGSWYMNNPKWEKRTPPELKEELDGYLRDVPGTIDGQAIPPAGARVVISPHAGYDFSGPCAAWSFKAFDCGEAKRIFILGPSHRYYLKGCAVTGFQQWATPFGNLTVDTEILDEIKSTWGVGEIPLEYDEQEHSMEMQAPYLWLRLQTAFGAPKRFPKIVPILIGDNSRAAEKEVGRLLLPYLKDPANAFIVSSDFCHWGRSFKSWPYSHDGNLEKITRLSAKGGVPSGIPVHEFIRILDKASMDAIETGKHDAFADNLALTRNSVCGRHPIGVMMAALELLAKEQPAQGKHKFKFIEYQRSENAIRSTEESSVSYCAAYAVI